MTKIQVDSNGKAITLDGKALVASEAPAGTISITENGSYDVINYANANVNISGGSRYGISIDNLLGNTNADGVLQAPEPATAINFNGVQDLANKALRRFFKDKSISVVSFPDLINISGDNALEEFCYNAGTTTVSFPKLVNVTGDGAFKSSFSMLYNHLTSISFPKLEKIGKDTVKSYETNSTHFYKCIDYCYGIVSLEFPELKEIYCTDYNSIYYGTFYGNTSVQKMYFPKLNTITYASGAGTSFQSSCNYIFSGCNALTELHFAAANQAAIEATTGYSTAWGRGAGNVTIYFDL